jgi:hypothetical protein
MGIIFTYKAATMPNITLTVDEQVVKKVRKIAVINTVAERAECNKVLSEDLKGRTII